MSTEQYIHVRCGRPFSKTKTVKVLYTCTPRKPPSEVKADDPKPTPVLLGTVVCPSALSVTAGLSVTGLKERNFQFVESVEPAVLDENGQEVSPAMLVERVGTSESSDEQVNPFTLGHVRFWDSRSRGLGLHASLGPLFDFDDNEVKLGFATGVSLSVRDNFFFTLGVALGRETHLDGGFELGDLKVGESMEIPTTSSWEQTYFVGVSYKVNQ